MMKHIGLILLCCLLGGVAMASPAKKAAAAKEKTDTEVDAPTTQTDIVGSQEAPGVFNIVPWKDRAAKLPQKEVSTSILRETLQPLDREVLRREIRLQEGLAKE